MLITYHLKCFTMLFSDLSVHFQSNGSSNTRIWQAHTTDGDAAQVLSGTHCYPTQMLTPLKCSHYSEVFRLSGLGGADFMLSALNCSLIPSQVNLSYNKFAIQEYTFSQSLSIILLPPLTHALVSPCQTLRGRWQTSKQAWSRWLRKMSGKSFRMDFLLISPSSTDLLSESVSANSFCSAGWGGFGNHSPPFM